MLMSMQPSPSAAPSAKFPNFAGILADFTASGKKPPAGDLDFLEEDVACLSYEPALRNRARFKPQPPSSETGPNSAAVVPRSPRVVSTEADINAGLNPRAPTDTAPSPRQSGRRCSSVTVRFSAPESDQLHLRAAEAGLTVSAYLRSCAFEVESLRAEVKSALAQLRPEGAPTEITPEAATPVRRRRWLHLFTRLSRNKPQI
jgi:hypothetical protein